MRNSRFQNCRAQIYLIHPGLLLNYSECKIFIAYYKVSNGSYHVYVNFSKPPNACLTHTKKICILYASFE